MKISELIKELEELKSKLGDLVVIAKDEEGTYEISEAKYSTYTVYDGKKEGPYDIASAVRLR